MTAFIYTSYASYLYDKAMTMWYAGATFTPANPWLVDMSEFVHARSLIAAHFEGVAHPDDANYWDDSWDDAGASEDGILF